MWPLALVALVPLWRAVEPASGVTGRTALGQGFVFGSVAYAGGFVWLWELVGVFLGGSAPLGAALWLAYGAWFAAGYAVYALATWRARAQGFSIALAALPPLLALEWLYPALFPVHLGDALAGDNPWVQLADLGGPLLLSAFVASANAAVFEGWRWLRGRRPFPVAMTSAIVTVVVLGFAYGELRAAALARAMAGAPKLRVGLVQANLGALEKRRDPAEVERRHHEASRTLLAQGELDLLVWPETVFARGLLRPLPISGELIRGEIRTPLLFGGVSIEPALGGRATYNSALLIGADGTIREAYDKNLLVPFAEYVPLAALAAPLAAHFPHVQRFAAGSDTPALALGPWRIATPICSETVDASFVRRMVRRNNPHLLVSLANDGWFGASQEPHIHLQLARLRAIEHRRTLVRATNSGISALIDPLGRIADRTALLSEATLRGPVPLLASPTLYTHLGSWPGPIALAVTIIAVAVRRGRGAKETRPPAKGA